MLPSVSLPMLHRDARRRGLRRELLPSHLLSSLSLPTSHIRYPPTHFASFYYFLLFTLTTRLPSALNARVSSHVFAGRITCLRRRDGGSSLNAAATLTLSFSHSLSSSIRATFSTYKTRFPMRCPKRRLISTTARQDSIYKKEYQKNKYIYVYI